ncbi:unnamed protein product [Owenia fusiformis]|uniref:ubiquitinyl hydrolase 1 n=1 Tax=Owenia fusiformis TaxID=6347 RepID=A0A8J1XRV9_OWEFU|nr:unnamed protein product [Owenia fusiformis]
MTVEQSALPPDTQKVRERLEQDFAQIREFTGVGDPKIINKAIQTCTSSAGQYNVEDVINMLLPDSNKQQMAVIPSTVTALAEGGEQTAGNKPPPQTETSATQGSEAAAGNDSIENDDIQKAIEASLQESQGILGGQILSREEQDISRILEQSMLETKAGIKRKRGDIWFVDPLNPHERKRDDNCPVGLKNVGNTCWFSAVVQCLFQIPKFRHLVLNFVAPTDLSQGSTQERRNLLFMQELRQLFALMIGSKRKYVDPSKAVEILKEAFTSTSSAGASDCQQDVSEFQHKLLEWLEDAFKSDRSRPSSPAESPSTAGETSNPTSHNPMVDLFYGQFRCEGMYEGNDFSKQETFGQYPLSVNGFKDVHESLEAATAQLEIETVNGGIGDNKKNTYQEQWFTRLPPVLTFELSRFKFNTALGRPEKIHNKLSFPETIYMDRYMEGNKGITRQRREEVKSLKEQLLQLQTKLDKFTNYGSGPKRFPLQDVLQYALEFAQSNKEGESSPSKSEALPSTPPNVDKDQDVDMDSPQSSSSMQTDSPGVTPTKQPAPHPDVVMTTPTPKSPPFSRNMPLVFHPAPRHVSAQELRVLETCLHRWRTEVEADVKELQDSINSLDDSVSSMYSDIEMKKFAYRLHAVLVHEGQATLGHYWAYIYDKHKKVWCKYNDIAVIETTWEDILRESMGGYHNASAYCLMYLDCSKEAYIEDGEKSASLLSLDSLPADLMEFVKEDNCKFGAEIQEWDKKLLEKQNVDNDCTIVAEKKASTISTQTLPKPVPKQPPLAMIHAQLALTDTMNVVEGVVDELTKREQMSDADPKLDELFVQACNEELKRLQGLSTRAKNEVPKDDQRLAHLIVYLLANGVGNPIITRVIYEHFTYLQILANDEKCARVKRKAQCSLDTQIKSKFQPDSKHEQMYKKLQDDYNFFRRTVQYFILGLDHFHNEKYEESLRYLLSAIHLNKQLMANSDRMKGLDWKLLYYYRRQSLLHIHEIASQQFESDENIDVLTVMCDLVIPCLYHLNNTPFKDDEQALEEIREKWCQFLGLSFSSKEKTEKLQDFLQKLLDASEKHTVVKLAPVNRPQDSSDLINQYRRVISVSIKNGDYEAAMNSK